MWRGNGYPGRSYPHSCTLTAFHQLVNCLEIAFNRESQWQFSPLSFTSLLSSATCKASSDNHFAFKHFFSFGIVWVTASYTMLRTTIHSSSGTLSDLTLWSYLSPPLYNHKGFDLGHIWMAWWFSLLSWEIKMPVFCGSWRKQGSSRKTSTSALLITLKPLSVWITTNCGKFLENGNTKPHYLPPEKSVCRLRSNS